MAKKINEEINIAIIGGGISGLCLALGMFNQASHIRIHIYEAAPRFAEIGAGVGLGPNARRALRLLDPRLGEAYERLKTNNIDSNTKSSKGLFIRYTLGMDHATRPDLKAGQTICDAFCEGGISSVHRARFLEQLVALLPEIAQESFITFNSHLVSIEDIKCGSEATGVKLTFANGSTAIADAVIGCDGIRSSVRRALLGNDSPAIQPVFTGKYVYRSLIPMDKAAAALGEKSAKNALHRLGYNGHVLTYPIEKGSTMNVVAFRKKEDGIWPMKSDWIETATREEMRADFAGFGEETHRLIDEMEKCDKWALFDHLPASTYHREGRICLIGDAAHASTPHLGAAAGMSIEDALVMSALFGEVTEKEDIRRAFVTFEAIRKGRTQRLVAGSREMGSLYEFGGEGIEDGIEKIAQALPQRYDWVWDHDLEQELADARRYMENLS